MSMTNREFAESLRLFADFYEGHPDFPSIISYSQNDGAFWTFAGSLEHLAECAKAFGTFTKGLDGEERVKIEKPFGHLVLQVCLSRAEFCQHVVVGTKRVKAKVPVYVEREIDEEIVEWRCSMAPLTAPVPKMLEVDGEEADS